ncbi:uncharacterized protein I303_100715 [Kwoniella dejecticola CBS 10117]|uniref:Hexosyltransferase n=1 Tax=Kwoniella dejecticola CBS 10117 TaxID=1296121 RepID=A0A1A6AFQ5_9TREE|nr:uncharacterized protein I303_00718 [Kwoniella dejecticola CBS 10117]OBR88900.1 hypothetical protein I303_00718 [Kwoniella dejecticola CBS 10117]
MQVLRYTGQSLRYRSRLPLVLIISFLSFLSLIHLRHALQPYINLPSHHRYNLMMHKAPEWSHKYWQKIMHNPAALLSPPPVISGLRAAPWAGSRILPDLTAPNYTHKELPFQEGHKVNDQQISSPALLMLHIFSTPRAQSRERRRLIRRLNLLEAVPAEYRHLVELKFVVGMNKPVAEGEEGYESMMELEKDVENEMSEHGDLIRLKLLENGENMNNGKSWEWLRYVGRKGARQAWWVLKCDDDTLPIIPNLLHLLLTFDPNQPIYLGSSLGRWTGYHYYFQGMMYGFSWGVVKTMAVADVPASTRNDHWDEDARIGAVMFSLPLAPNANPKLPYCSPPDRPNPMYSLPPPNPDPCTGLFRLDLASKIGAWHNWLIDDEQTAIAWHELKNENDYREAYVHAQQGFKREGRQYQWNVPKVFRSVADTPSH